MAPVHVSIMKAGLVTAVGLGSAQTSAAIRAGVPGFKETPLHDRHFDPFVMALLPDEALPDLEESLATADPGLSARRIRMLRLGSQALEEALEGVDEPGRIPLFLGGPEVAEGRPEVVDADFLAQLIKQAGLEIELTTSRTFPAGRAAGLQHI